MHDDRDGRHRERDGSPLLHRGKALFLGDASPAEGDHGDPAGVCVAGFGNARERFDGEIRYSKRSPGANAVARRKLLKELTDLPEGSN